MDEQTTAELLKEIESEVFNGVEKSLEFTVKELEDQMFSLDPEQRKYEEFYRDLFNIPKLRKALKKTVEGYVHGKEEHKKIGMTEALTKENILNRYIPDVKTLFLSDYHSGVYQTSPLPKNVANATKMLINTLPNLRERMAIMMYYGFTLDRESYTYEEIGDELRVSKQRASQIIRKGLRTLKFSDEHTLMQKYGPIPVRSDLAYLRKFENNSLRQQLKEKDDFISKAVITQKPGEEPRSYADVTLAELQRKGEISLRTYNALRGGSTKNGEPIVTLPDLMKISADLRKYKNIGDRSLEEVQNVFDRRSIDIKVQSSKKNS